MKLRAPLTTSLITLMLCMSGPGHAAQPVADSHPIVIGERFEIHSQATGETRSYFVHRPSDYALSSARYPLMIVLDGEDNFNLASTTADLLADAGLIPPMLVVGIPNTDRNRDLIPFTPRSGTENFLKFLTTELIPKLDQDFRTLPYRILVAHSNGGLFGLYSLMKAPGVFKGYILARPGFNDQDGELLGGVTPSLDRKKQLCATINHTHPNRADT